MPTLQSIEHFTLRDKQREDPYGSPESLLGLIISDEELTEIAVPQFFPPTYPTYMPGNICVSPNEQPIHYG